MNVPWRRRDRDGIEGELRAYRPMPSADLVDEIVHRVEHERDARWRGARVALAGAMTAAMLVALAAFGGLGQAASAVKGGAGAVKATISGEKSPPETDTTAAESQYGEKVVICHRQGKKAVTLSLPPDSAAQHLRDHKGDTPGPCP